MRLRKSPAGSVCLWLLLIASASAQENRTPGGSAPPNQPAPPSQNDQRILLARVRQEALRYQRELPDFLCTQLTARSVDETGTGKHWKQRDTLEVEDVYVSGFVNHKLILMNGVAPRKTYQQLTGFLSETVLHSVGFLPAWLFGPQATTQFEWLREATLNDRRVQVFSVHLPASDSKLTISTPRHAFIAGVDGVIFIDAISAVVRRFEIRMDLPPASPIQEAEMDIDYNRVDISGRAFLLPVKFEVRARFGPALVKNETEVVRYQKYAAETTIHFDQAPLEGEVPSNE